MNQPAFSLNVLLRRADARWRQIEADRPDLTDAVTLQRALVQRIAGLTAAIEDSDWAPPNLEPTTIVKTLRGSHALLHEHPVALPMSLLEPAFHDLCAILADSGAGDAARHIHDVVREQRLDATSLLNASLARRQSNIRAGAVHLDLAPDLLWLVAELTVGPIAQDFQRSTLTGDVDSAVRETLDAWGLGTCPACGSWPALGESLHGDVTLRCSFCGGGWNLPTPACCPYCLSPGVLHNPASSDQPERQLLSCEACCGYLKGVGVTEPIPFVLLPIEDLATTALDVDAMARNLVRPPLPEMAAKPPDDECQDTSTAD